MLYKKFFVVSGSGVSRTSTLMAFDKALFEAGIAQCNLVSVSSILPLGAKHVKPVKAEPGTVTFTIIAREDGLAGEEITAGIGWAYCTHSGKDSYGLVVEDHGRKTLEQCKRDLKIKLKEMANARGMEIEKYETQVSTLENIPEKKFGCVVAALIYVQ